MTERQPGAIRVGQPVALLNAVCYLAARAAASMVRATSSG
ncbi:MAG: hypothetical protein QOH84_6557 [Kribbellaceae bacterium]|jgi:hypothetical protein|nr:hypothetical protein [Kribbellaceae bacterium]